MNFRETSEKHFACRINRFSCVSGSECIVIDSRRKTAINSNQPEKEPTMSVSAIASTPVYQASPPAPAPKPVAAPVKDKDGDHDNGKEGAGDKDRLLNVKA
jgi:hypothetical protein